MLLLYVNSRNLKKGEQEMSKDRWVTKFTCLPPFKQQNEFHLLLFAFAQYKNVGSFEYLEKKSEGTNQWGWNVLLFHCAKNDSKSLEKKDKHKLHSIILVSSCANF